MRNSRTRRIATGCLAGLVFPAWLSLAAEGPKLSGSLIGFVGDSAGVPQMGATVLLFNRYERLIDRTLTTEKGAFGFESLPPDLYSLRVNLASYVPAIKKNISIQPGMRSFLAINLASVLSSIELVYTAPGEGPLMSDDWKWVLRSSSATRPALRIMPGIDISDPTIGHTTSGTIFSDTRGVVRLSAGEGGAVSLAGNQPDLGTAFAVATSLFGSNQVEVSGNVGYASHSGIPTAGFRTSFSRSDAHGLSPQVNLTMRQLFLPARAGSAFLRGQQEGAPALRTMSLSFADSTQLSDEVQLEYGAAMESVSFLDRLNYLSPFARLTYDLGSRGSLILGFSSGAPPAELLARDGDWESSFQHDLAMVSAFPRTSLRNGSVQVQRAENYEIGYRKVAGSRTYTVGVYRESVSNAALTLVAPGGFYSANDLLPDLSSSSSIFNAGRYRRHGYLASVTQALGDEFNLMLAYGSGGVLEPRADSLESRNPEELRSLIRRGQRNWLAARVAGTSPRGGTRFSTSYQWRDYRALNPGHLYLTQGFYPDAGLNVLIRQPLPGSGLLAGRIEASAELRNLLAQGYLPISTSTGKQILLIQAPRTLRGGLSFIF